jgi:menaquinone-dependent protoporphyrinogen oxidase
MIQERGDEVKLADARKLPATVTLDSFDAVIVGASLHTWKFQREIVEFVTRHLRELQSKPSAFFGVSLSEADPDPGRRQHLTDSINAFFEDAQWQPDRRASFAGAIPQSRLSWLMRLFWLRLEKQRYDYTDWDAVTQFANEFAEAAAKRTAEFPAAV